MRLLMAVPVYNESRYVEHVLDQIRRFHSDVLVVDDGSSDGTSQILQRMAAAGQIEWIRHPVNRGYGQSIIDAFKYAAARGYDWVITMDCDEQHEPRTIPAFVREIQTDRWDIISGSRYLERRSDDDRPPGDRRRINAAITQKLNALLGLELTDAFCGFKAHRVSAMRRLSLDESGYAFPLQFWPQAAKAALRITEIPVRLIYNDPGRNFGGILDDADRRLRHYLSVLAAEMNRPASPPPRSPDESSSNDCELAACPCCNHD